MARQQRSTQSRKIHSRMRFGEGRGVSRKNASPFFSPLAPFLFLSLLPTRANLASEVRVTQPPPRVVDRPPSIRSLPREKPTIYLLLSLASISPLRGRIIYTTSHVACTCVPPALFIRETLFPILLSSSSSSSRDRNEWKSMNMIR